MANRAVCIDATTSEETGNMMPLPPIKPTSAIPDVVFFVVAATAIVLSMSIVRLRKRIKPKRFND